MTKAEIIPGQLAFEDAALTLTFTNTPATTAEASPSPVGDPPPALDPPAAAEPETEPEPEPLAQVAPLMVEVIRSARRTKTAQARLVGSTIEIRIPSRCSVDEERELIEHFTAKFERQRSTDIIDLEARAARLAGRFGLPLPASIRWVTNQRCRWGSCTPSDRTIRLSDRLAAYPTWVLDYVILHELAHLVESGHTPAFWALVDPYPLAERAKGFLIAKGMDGD